MNARQLDAPPPSARRLLAPRTVAARFATWASNVWRRLPRSPLERLAWGLPLGTLIVLSVALYSTYRTARTDVEVVLRAAIEQEILGLESIFHAAGIEALIADIDERVASGIDPDAIYLLIDARGQRLAGNLSAWPANVARQDEASFAVPDAKGQALQGKVFRLFGRRWLLVGRHSPLASFKTTLARNLLIAGLFVLIGSVLLSAAALVPLRRRLAALHEQARLIREGDLSQRVAVRARGDELDELAIDFNATFAELERAMNGAKHVSSMIAHDMRRPITALRYQLDDVLKDPGLPSTTAEAISESITATDEILATFTALLQLARLESGTYAAMQQSLSLDAVVRDAVETYEPVAQASDRALTAMVQPGLAPVLVRGDRNLWFQLLQNLLDNALNHGAGNIEVGIGCDGDLDGGLAGDRANQLDDDRAGDDVVLTVRDHGSGVPDATLPHLFERFYRTDSARTQGGSGVGLALVQAIAELHGGSVRAENAAPGLRICVRVPRAAPERS